MPHKHFLSKKQLAAIKARLIAKKDEIIEKSTFNDKFCLDRNELSDVLDEANINIQASQELRFRNREMLHLKKINKILKSLDEGTYGYCEDCENEIAYERLLARPTAEMCITCKEESEHSERNNFFQSRSKSLGRTMAEMGKTWHKEA